MRKRHQKSRFFPCEVKKDENRLQLIVAKLIKKAHAGWWRNTLQDLDAKRHTEIDMFSGAIIRMGKQLGISTPYNEFTFHMIKALEEKNDGNFDYI